MRVVYGLAFATWSFMKFAPNINDISMRWALKLCWQQLSRLRRNICLPAVVWPSITTLILTMGAWVAANGLMTVPPIWSMRTITTTLAASGDGYPTFDHGTHPFPTCQASDFDRKSPPPLAKSWFCMLALLLRSTLLQLDGTRTLHKMLRAGSIRQAKLSMLQLFQWTKLPGSPASQGTS